MDSDDIIIDEQVAYTAGEILAIKEKSLRFAMEYLNSSPKSPAQLIETARMIEYYLTDADLISLDPNPSSKD